MDRLQILEMKTAIRREYETKINLLREEMEFALSSLGKVEQTLFSADTEDSAPGKKIEQGNAITRSRRTRFPSNLKATKKPNVITRVKTALGSMSGDFTRKELHERTEMDGFGKIPSNTFSPTFLKLKNAEFCTVSEPQGTQAGIYRKVDAVEPKTAPSPAQ